MNKLIAVTFALLAAGFAAQPSFASSGAKKVMASPVISARAVRPTRWM